MKLVKLLDYYVKLFLIIILFLIVYLNILFIFFIFLNNVKQLKKITFKYVVICHIYIVIIIQIYVSLVY